MNENIYYAVLTILLLIAAVGYFRIADRFNIIDKPNERSSHTVPTIRGGGILFPIAGLLWFGAYDFELPSFMLGLILLAIISFMDDLNPQPAAFRLSIHALAIFLLFSQASFSQWPSWLITLAVIISIGSISAFNFMDGINGITGVYAIVSLCTFYFLNNRDPFIDPTFIITFLISTLIFLFFNFRKKARCFAGDVGSVSMAGVQIFLLISLIQSNGNLGWVLLFLVYGVESVITILARLKKKENIFKPHRTHLYQYLANEYRWDHRLVAIIYGLTQAGINMVLISIGAQGSISLVILAGTIVGLYGIARYYLTKNLQLG